MRQTQDLLDHVKGENDVIEEVRRTLIRERDAAIARAEKAEAEVKTLADEVVELSRGLPAERWVDTSDGPTFSPEIKKGE